MHGKEVNLNQMLQRREIRADSQNKLLKKYNSPLISFSMNIPGPIKTNELILKAFEIGKNLLLENLSSQNIIVNEIIETHEVTGDEILISINSEPKKLKDITLEIENNSPLGRLFDMDVINNNGEKLSRKNFRKCLICDKQAQECARSRTHSVKEMQDTIQNILENTVIIKS